MRFNELELVWIMPTRLMLRFEVYQALSIAAKRLFQASRMRQDSAGRYQRPVVLLRKGAALSARLKVQSSP